MSSLLKISADMEALENLLEESNGEITPAVEEALATWGSDLEGQMANKVDNYASLITDLKLRAKAREEEGDRLRLLAANGEKAAEFLKGRLKAVFEQHGLKKLETERYTLTLVKNGGICPMEIDEADVPIEYCSAPADPPPDKARIRNELEAGTLLSFARLGERGSNLRIK